MPLPVTITVLERFAKQFEIQPNGCWAWIGAKQSEERGVFGHDYKNYPAYRFLYEVIHGELPKKLVCDHLCRNPNCVNPRHLEPVTDRVNILRGVSPAANNARKTKCKNGHEFGPQPTWAITAGRRRCLTCHNARHRKGEK